MFSRPNSRLAITSMKKSGATMANSTAAPAREVWLLQRKAEKPGRGLGKTTGWKPSYLLMRTSRSISSPWLLSERDVPVAVKRGSRYVAVR